MRRSTWKGTQLNAARVCKRKLNGIVTWYFDHVVESLPLMLQIAFLLLGWALSKYLWGINVTIFGVAFYVFVCVAGAVSMSCPHQAPGAQILRFLWQKVLDRSVFFATKGPTGPHSKTQPDPVQALDGEVTILGLCCISWMLQTSLDRTINELILRFLGSILGGA